MSIGSKVRAAFGPYEPLVSNLWRSMFVDIGQWTEVIAGWSPAPRRVLEVGCGEGYSATKLALAFPGVTIDAIDISGNIGRLYDGPVGAAKFRLVYVEEIAAESPAAYDLIILSDVLHHVPSAQRRSLLGAIRTSLAPGGYLAVKDWDRAPAKPIHWAVYGSDRFLTCDRVQYLKRGEAREMLCEVFGDDAIVAEASIRPWTNNYAFHIIRN